jgi:hypothetical protein
LPEVTCFLALLLAGAIVLENAAPVYSTTHISKTGVAPLLPGISKPQVIEIAGLCGATLLQSKSPTSLVFTSALGPAYQKAQPE